MKRRGWHECRFEPRQTAVQVECAVCTRPMWLPASKVTMYKTCGAASCVIALRTADKVARRRRCKTCGTEFTPRRVQITNGGGQFCSQQCNTTARRALLSPDAQRKAVLARAKLEAQGLIKRYRGEENPRWMGGREAAIQRRIATGKSAESVRRWRKANPDKVREFGRRRSGRKLGKLPYGTIPRIRTMQRNRCAICRVSIARALHVDHIVPLALGGAHEARNIQLLCAPCNLKKSAKDPIRYMQQIGRLL